MSSIPGTKVLSTVVPLDTADTYATHNPKYGKGGWRTVADSTERTGTLGTQIPMARREEAMIVFQADNKHFYQLGSDLTTWTDLGLTLGGGSGGGLTVTSVKSSNYTASSNEEVPVDSTAAPREITLPAVPSHGDKVIIKDISGTSQTNNITIDRNGNTINGLSSDLLIDVEYGVAALTFYNDPSLYGWIVE